MTVSRTAIKYAQALTEVASESGESRKALEQVCQFAELYSTSKELRDAVANPSFPLDIKVKVVGAIADRAGFLKIVRNFLLVLLERSRLGQIQEIAAAMREVMDAREGIVRVDVVSASRVSEGQKKLLAAKMAELTGCKVRLDLAVDESLIGGLKIQVGSTVFDGTVQAQLQQLGRRLSA